MTAPVAPGTKAARQARIAAILGREQVHSQEQLAGLLGQYAGLRVTQATLSRDLDELGVVRLRGADGTLVYALPGDPGGPGSPPGTAFAYPERDQLTPAPPVPPAAPRTPPAARTASAPRTRSAARTPPAARTASAGRTASADRTRSAPPTASAGEPDPAGEPGPAGRDGATRESPAAVREPRGAAGGSRPAAGEPAPAAGESRPRALASASGSVPPRLVRYLTELLTSAEASANLVVLRTPAGAAQFLASAIDHAAWPAILGTVAGDDTVLVIARDPAGGDALADDFRRLAERRR